MDEDTMFVLRSDEGRKWKGERSEKYLRPHPTPPFEGFCWLQIGEISDRCIPLSEAGNPAMTHIRMGKVGCGGEFHVIQYQRCGIGKRGGQQRSRRRETRKERK
jgi:hypothetical protein